MSETAPEPSAAPPPAPRSRSGALGLGILLVAAGGAWFLSAVGVLDVGLEAGIGLALVGIGAVVALDAGHSHGVLVTLAVILSLVGAATTWVDVDLFDGGVGDRIVAPTSASDTAAGYDLGVGKLTLDLTSLEAAGGGAVPVRAEVGVGQLDVTVPQDAEVMVDAHVSVGNIHIAGVDHGGFDVDERSLLRGTGQAFVLRADVGIGEVRITRAP